MIWADFSVINKLDHIYIEIIVKKKHTIYLYLVLYIRYSWNCNKYHSYNKAELVLIFEIFKLCYNSTFGYKWINCVSKDYFCDISNWITVLKDSSRIAILDCDIVIICAWNSRIIIGLIN